VNFLPEKAKGTNMTSKFDRNLHRLVQFVHKQLSVQARVQKLLPGAHARGMSLIEILVVLAIIGLVMGTLAVNFGSIFGDSQVDITRKMKMGEIEKQFTMYNLTKHSCPTSLKDLIARGMAPDNAKDAWDTEFQFTCPGTEGRTVDLVSAGPDRQFGTEDDIRNVPEKE
jgi:general secretion pathway protein G